MVQGYYKLDEAAGVLGISSDELKRMAQKNEIRSFQDRGTWRFRIQDVQELARQRGQQSDPEAPIPPPPKSFGPKSFGPRSGAPKSFGPKGAPPKSSLHPPAGPSSSGPKSKPPKTPNLEKKPEVFDFELSADEVDLGAGLEGLVQKPGASGKTSGKTPKPGSDSDVRLVGSGSSDDYDVLAQPISPKPGSDSDVRLVGEGSEDFGADLVDHAPTPKPGSDSGARLVGQHGSDDFDVTAAFDTSQILPDSDVRLEGLPGPSTPKVGGHKSSLNVPRPSKLAPGRSDSGVRLVPMDSDSDVRLTPDSGADVPIGDLPLAGAKDSDVRLERYDIAADQSEEGMLTEEINLDEEIRRREEAAKGKPPVSRVRKKSEMSSPFELTDTNLVAPPPAEADEDSSDFEIDLGATVAMDEDFGLELPTGMTQLKAPSSKARKPDTEHIDFAASDELPATPKPGSDDSSDDFELSASADSDSSFELEIDSDEDMQPGAADSDSVELAPSESEFELALSSDAEIEAVGDADSDSSELAPSSDSEFELTIDSDSEFDLSVDSDSSADSQEVKDESSEDFELSVDDSDAGAGGEESDFELSVDDSSGEAAAVSDSEQDIFESDEIPELDDESASEVESLDSDSADISVDDDSGSQVMALDEEEADEGAVTMAGDEGDFSFEEEEGEGEAEEEPFGEIEEQERAVPSGRLPKYQVVAAPPWGIVPVLFMFPCVIIMLLVGFMGFELVQSMTGYRPPGFLTKTFSELLGKPLP